MRREKLLPGDPFRPMEPRSTAAPFDDEHFFFEPKWDGIRVVAHVQKNDVRNPVQLFTRTLRPCQDKYEEIVGSLLELQKKVGGSFILDGELIVLDENNLPSFPLILKRHLLINPQKIREAAVRLPANYVAFDLLYIDRNNLFTARYVDRRKELERLAALFDRDQSLWLCPSYSGNGHKVFEAMAENKMEGIVAKRDNSSYVPGKKNSSWLKVKCWRQGQFIVGGYRTGESGLIVLLLGMYTPFGLQYVGAVPYYPSKQPADLIRKLELEPSDVSPFLAEPRLPSDAVWLQPTRTVPVRFLEWGRHGMLRNATLHDW